METRVRIPIPEPVMSSVLPPELQSFIADGIASGRFRSEDEAIVEGLNLLRGRERKLEALRADIQIGVDEADAGLVSPLDIDDIKRRGRERLAAESREK